MGRLEQRSLAFFLIHLNLGVDLVVHCFFKLKLHDAYKPWCLSQLGEALCTDGAAVAAVSN